MLDRMQIVNGALQKDAGGNAPVLIYTNPSVEEKAQLTQEFGIDENTLAYALDPHEMARVEFKNNHTAIFIKRPKHYSAEDNFLFKILSVGVFLFASRVIIVVDTHVSLFDRPGMGVIQSVQDVLIHLINASVFHFEEHLAVINLCSEQLEGEIHTSMENKQLFHLFTLEKSLVYYLNAIRSNNQVITKLLNHAVKLGFHEENIAFLNDILVENNQCYDQAQIYSQVLSSMMDARVSIVNNNLNVLIKNLSIITISLMLPTLWLTIFSINVPIPLQDNPYTFWGVVIITLILGSLSVYLLIRRPSERARRWKVSGLFKKKIN